MLEIVRDVGRETLDEIAIFSADGHEAVGRRVVERRIIVYGENRLNGRAVGPKRSERRKRLRLEQHDDAVRHADDQLLAGRRGAKSGERRDAAARRSRLAFLDQIVQLHRREAFAHRPYFGAIERSSNGAVMPKKYARV